jgi:hypothetical protein
VNRIFGIHAFADSKRIIDQHVPGEGQVQKKRGDLSPQYFSNRAHIPINLRVLSYTFYGKTGKDFLWWFSTYRPLEYKQHLESRKRPTYNVKNMVQKLIAKIICNRVDKAAENVGHIVMYETMMESMGIHGVHPDKVLIKLIIQKTLPTFLKPDVQIFHTYIHVPHGEIDHVHHLNAGCSACLPPGAQYRLTHTR